MFQELKIQKPRGKKYTDQYLNVCLVLDNDIRNENCTGLQSLIKYKIVSYLDSKTGWKNSKDKQFINWIKLKDNVRNIQLKFKDIGFGKNAYIADLKILFNSKPEFKPGVLSKSQENFCSLFDHLLRVLASLNYFFERDD